MLRVFRPQLQALKSQLSSYGSKRTTSHRYLVPSRLLSSTTSVGGGLNLPKGQPQCILVDDALHENMNSCLGNYLKRGEVAAALAYLKDNMVGSGVQPRGDLLNQLLRDLCSSDNVEEASAVLSLSIKPSMTALDEPADGFTLVAFSHVIDCCVKHDMIESALQLFQRAKDLRICLDLPCCNGLLSRVGAFGGRDVIQDILMYMKFKELVPTADTFAAAIRSALQCSDLEYVAELLKESEEEVVELPIETWLAIAFSSEEYIRSGKREEATIAKELNRESTTMVRALLYHLVSTWEDSDEDDQTAINYDSHGNQLGNNGTTFTDETGMDDYLEEEDEEEGAPKNMNHEFAIVEAYDAEDFDWDSETDEEEDVPSNGELGHMDREVVQNTLSYIPSRLWVSVEPCTSDKLLSGQVIAPFPWGPLLPSQHGLSVVDATKFIGPSPVRHIVDKEGMEIDDDEDEDDSIDDFDYDEDEGGPLSTANDNMEKEYITEQDFWQGQADQGAGVLGLALHIHNSCTKDRKDGMTYFDAGVTQSKDGLIPNDTSTWLPSKGHSRRKKENLEALEYDVEVFSPTHKRSLPLPKREPRCGVFGGLIEDLTMKSRKVGGEGGELSFKTDFFREPEDISLRSGKTLMRELLQVISERSRRLGNKEEDR